MKKFAIALFLLLIGPAQAGDIFRDELPQSALNITTTTLIKAAPGMLVSFAVTVAGSAAGTINDSATTGAAAASNAMAPTPNTAGIYYYPAQFKNGLVVVPGTGQTIVVNYQ